MQSWQQLGSCIMQMCWADQFSSECWVKLQVIECKQKCAKWKHTMGTRQSGAELQNVTDPANISMWKAAKYLQNFGTFNGGEVDLSIFSVWIIWHSASLAGGKEKVSVSDWKCFLLRRLECADFMHLPVVVCAHSHVDLAKLLSLKGWISLLLVISCGRCFCFSIPSATLVCCVFFAEMVSRLASCWQVFCGWRVTVRCFSCWKRTWPFWPSALAKVPACWHICATKLWSHKHIYMRIYMSICAHLEIKIKVRVTNIGPSALPRT